MLARLSGYWFFASGALGLFFPYFALYLEENVALRPAEVGLVLAVPRVIGIVAQPLWGQFADRTGSRVRTLALLCVGAGVGYLALLASRDFTSALLLTALAALFGSAVMPLGTSVSMGALDERAQSHFGRVRVFGTIGFLCTVVSGPAIVDFATARFELGAHAAGASRPGLGSMFVVAALLCWISAAIALSLPRSSALELRAAPRDYRLLLGNKAYLRVLGFMFAIYVTLDGPMMLFPLYVTQRGGDMNTLSRLWIWMLLLEIPLVLYSGALFDRLGPRRMLIGAALAGGLRWAVSGYVEAQWAVELAQMLHAVVVSGIIVGGSLYVESLVPRQLRASAQAGLMVLGANVGGILSTTIAGAAIGWVGVDAVYTAMGLCGILAAILGNWLLPPQSVPALEAAPSPSP